MPFTVIGQLAAECENEVAGLDFNPAIPASVTCGTILYMYGLWLLPVFLNYPIFLVCVIRCVEW